jgi:hypothetical protein
MILLKEQELKKYKNSFSQFILEKRKNGKFFQYNFPKNRRGIKMTTVHYENFVNLKYKPKDTDVICQFKVTPSGEYSFREVCSIVAGESSVGTWTDVGTMNPNIGKTLAPKVYYLDEKNKRCRIAYPIELFE